MKRFKVDRARLENKIAESAVTVASLCTSLGAIAGICSEVIAALRASKKILAAGNGGSAAEAMHLAEELTGRFKSSRPALPAIALAADGTALTCIGNDFGFDSVFSRQVEALGGQGDVLVLFSTSGNSRNLVNALKAACRKKMKTVCFLGKKGGMLAGRGNHEVIVNHDDTARIQEAHQVVMHLLLDAVEEAYLERS